MHFDKMEVVFLNSSDYLRLLRSPQGREVLLSGDTKALMAELKDATLIEGTPQNVILAAVKKIREESERHR